MNKSVATPSRRIHSAFSAAENGRVTEALISTLIDAVDDTLCLTILDDAGRISFANGNFCQTIGFGLDELLGIHPMALTGQGDLTHAVGAVSAVLETGRPWRGLVCLRHHDGRAVWTDTMMRPILNASGDGAHRVLSLHVDVSLQVEASRKLAAQAHFPKGEAGTQVGGYILRAQLAMGAGRDSVTGLHTREQAESFLHQAICRMPGSTLCLFLVDVDNFHDVNTTEGYGEGDVLLRRLATALSEQLQPEDFIARLAADEFAVIRFGQEAVDAAEATMSNFVQALKVSGAKARADKALQFNTLSVGCSVYPQDGENPEDLFRNADIALRDARARGGNRYVRFASQHRELLKRQTAMVRELHEALERDHLRLYYQPIINPIEGRVVALEALLRWQHPMLGLLPPSMVLDSFKNVGIAIQVGNFVMHEATRQAGKWKRAGLGFGRIAFNTTTADFLNPGFTERLKAAMSSWDVDSSDICVEVTEGMFLSAEYASTLEELEKLHRLGVEIAFDDFGTGFASLMHLKLPTSRIKIDRSFVENIERDSVNREIVSAVVSMGTRIGKKVTAEGVETPAQMATLLEMGCTSQQGFLHSKPLPADAVPEFLKNLRPFTPLEPIAA